MKLLGHHDYRMTLRYTEITLETVGDEYSAAMKQLEARFTLAVESGDVAELDPDEALADIIRWVRKTAGTEPVAVRRAALLIRRLKRARTEVRAMARAALKGREAAQQIRAKCESSGSDPESG
jgi:hypothetical protein